MYSTETVTLYDDDSNELIVTGTFEYVDDEYEDGAFRQGYEDFHIITIKRDGIDITETYADDEIHEMAIRCLEMVE